VIDWWDTPGSKNHKRGLLTGQHLWDELNRRHVVRTRRPSEVDAKLWLLTLIRFWRDINDDPGSTHRLDDWFSIAHWVRLDLETLIELEGEVFSGVELPPSILRDIELRMLDVFLALGEDRLESILDPNTLTSSTSWINLLHDLKERQLSEHERCRVQGPREISLHGRLINHLRKQPTDVFRISPYRFEDLVAELLEGMGYSVTMASTLNESASGDLGRDILAWGEDDCGSYLMVVDTKNYRKDRPVGVRTVRGLLGAVEDEMVRRRIRDRSRVRGMLVTSSRFSAEALEFQRRHMYRLTLKKYEDVVAWVKQHRRGS
jgi:hypothetical protein